MTIKLPEPELLGVRIALVGSEVTRDGRELPLGWLQFGPPSESASLSEWVFYELRKDQQDNRFARTIADWLISNDVEFHYGLTISDGDTSDRCIIWGWIDIHDPTQASILMLHFGEDLKLHHIFKDYI